MTDNQLIRIANEALQDKPDLPFYVYSAIHQQTLNNIAITKPTLVFVMRGHKTIGQPEQAVCHSHHFVFLSNHKLATIRNIPDKKEYLALIIEFDTEDFSGLSLISNQPSTPYILGKTSVELETLLLQFLEISKWASANILSNRKKEILMCLYEMGYQEIASFGNNATLSFRIHALFRQYQFQNLTWQTICHALAMSESTIRRKLQLENQTIKNIKDNAQLGTALHLLQTSSDSIQSIAEQCGYFSPSRFTKNFKQRFGLTPSELRKTKAMS